MRMPKTSSARARSSDLSLLLLDTHVWLWEVFATGQLASRTRAAINKAVQMNQLRLSVISLWEISMLAARGKLELGKPAISWIAEAQAKSRITIEPLTSEIAVAAGHLPDGFRSDPADHIIVATARLTDATLMTRDRRILAYGAAGNVTVLAA